MFLYPKLPPIYFHSKEYKLLTIIRTCMQCEISYSMFASIAYSITYQTIAISVSKKTLNDTRTLNTRTCLIKQQQTLIVVMTLDANIPHFLTGCVVWVGVIVAKKIIQMSTIRSYG